jgi:hypothetical protein
VSRRRNRIHLIGICWILCACTLAFGFGRDGLEILYDQDKTVRFVAVPVLVLLCSPILALSRWSIFYAAMPVLALVATELGFSQIRMKELRVKTKRVAGEKYQAPDSIASFGAVPDAWATMRRRVDKKREWEVTYRFDSHGRRITPAPSDAHPAKAAIFLGGSQMFGSGVEDDETIAAAFARHQDEYRPYNYGFHRYGPSQVLDVVRKRDLRSEIPEPVGIAIQLLTDAGIRRVVGSMRIATGYCRRCSNYELEDSGQLVRHGDFSIGRPITTVFYSLLDESRILEYLGVDLPLDYRPEDLERTAAVITAVRDEIEATFPDAAFYAVIALDQSRVERMRRYLDDRDVIVLDHSDLFDRDDPAMRLSVTDGHPSALANDLTARTLVAQIRAHEDASDGND